ncbi:MAG TPA: GIY-YIG nuclease family protein [Candidatus Kryptonia bacterium]
MRELYWVYVIESEDGHHYTGQTDDLDRRVDEHNSGMSHSTKHGRNWRIVYSEQFETRREAMKREKYLKTNAGRRFLSRVIAGWSPSANHGRSSSSGS